MVVIPNRDQIHKGSHVEIETKADQGTGRFTAGIVDQILTNSQSHPHGIKVKLTDGQVGRVKHMGESDRIISFEQNKFEDLEKIQIPRVEDQNNEFKEFYQYDKNLESLTNVSENISKINGIKKSGQERLITAICSFGNSHHGGFVYLGIKSDGTISGLKKDKDLGKFKNYNDSFANHIRDKLGELIQDKVFITSKIQMKFRSVDENTICIIQILPSNMPLHLHTSKGLSFFVRGFAPRAEKMNEQEQFRYIKERFPNYL